MTSISSSKKTLIEQEVYSQMLVFNLLQTIQNEVKEDIDSEKYKYKMKINMNMAVGYIKKYYLMIMLTEDIEKRKQLYHVLHEKILSRIVPIRENRSFNRKMQSKNIDFKIKEEIRPYFTAG